jgi:hypothetical protein
MFRYGSVTRPRPVVVRLRIHRAHARQPIRRDRCASQPDPLASVFVPAYVSSPELTFGFMFALEDPERIAEVVRNLIVRKTVSVFRLARLSDDDGPPERYVVNWAVIPQISITTAAPDQEELRATRTMLVNAFLSEEGEVSLYSAQSSGPA